MEHEGFVYGTLVSGYLLGLVLLLVVFLVWRKVPRGTVFEIVGSSAGIFALLVPISYWVAERLVLHGSESFWCYVAPVIPVAIFVVWIMQVVKRRGELTAPAGASR